MLENALRIGMPGGVSSTRREKGFRATLKLLLVSNLTLGRKGIVLGLPFGPCALKAEFTDELLEVSLDNLNAIPQIDTGTTDRPRV